MTDHFRLQNAVALTYFVYQIEHKNLLICADRLELTVKRTVKYAAAVE